MEIIDKLSNIDIEIIKKYNINFAYNKVLVYDVDGEPKYFEPNTQSTGVKFDEISGIYHNNTIVEIEKKYNIKFPYRIKVDDNQELISDLNILASQMVHLYDIGNIINNGLVDDFIENGDNFIYPIIVTDNNIFLNSINLSNKLIEYIKSGNARLIFFYFMEGHYGSCSDDYKWMSELSSKYGLNNTNNIIINGNLLSGDIHEGLVNSEEILDNFKTYPFSWFEYCPLFGIGGSQKMLKNIREEYYNSVSFFVDNNKNNIKKYHFSCLNRLPKIHRLCIFSELMTNNEFSNKFILSLGSVKINYEYNDKMSFYNEVNNNILNDYKHGKEKMLSFFESYDQFNNYSYDCDDLENNKADIFNKSVHLNSFVNIVTESLINNNCVFFSEKTYKPIYACQPFIMVGNPFSLKVLKDRGYKTFDKWWDESYDLEPNFTRRLEKIVDVMFEISSWSLEKCFEVTNEMEDILINNFNVFMDERETKNIYKFLSTKKIDII